MKALLIELGATDKRALKFMSDSLSLCAHDHILSRKLLNRFSAMNGSMIAIIPPWLDLHQLETYHRGPQGLSGDTYEDGYFPQDLLVAFIRDYLRENGNRVVVCENWAWRREHIALQPWPPPRLACYGDNEVFHLLTPDIKDPDQIESAVISRHHWQTGICTECARVPEADIPDEAFLDEIVQNTSHIFIPAFDGTGYLIWKT
jgi:hypothetical protein